MPVLLSSSASQGGRDDKKEKRKKKSLPCLINEVHLKYDDGRGDDNDDREDEGIHCCQGALVLRQEKLIN